MKNLLYFFLCSILFCCCEEPNCKDSEEPDIDRIDASTFGFSPNNSASKNSEALQRAVDSGVPILVSTKGVYDLDKMIVLKSNTNIRFSNNTFVRKQKNREGKCAPYVFVNEGAFSKKFDENIEIHGLHLICNKLEDYAPILGLMGQLSFYYVKNLVIKNFTCLDLESAYFCIHVVNFDNILIEKIHIEGYKDGVHLGVGKNFKIKEGIFRTFDDPIALNAHDYDVSNPMVGWIENGVIENCRDLEQQPHVGFFCRMLAGAWVDWKSGMKVQKSDIVVNNGRLYRVVAPPDGRVYISNTPPTHESGYETINGINWYMMQEGELYNVGVRNVTFKNIIIEKNRETIFSIHFDTGIWSRSYYPGAISPIQENITIEGLKIIGEAKNILACFTPVKNLKFEKFEWSKGKIYFDIPEDVVMDYPIANLELNQTIFNPKRSGGIYTVDGRPVELTIKNSTNRLVPFYVTNTINIKEKDVEVVLIDP